MNSKKYKITVATLQFIGARGRILFFYSGHLNIFNLKHGYIECLT